MNVRGQLQSPSRLRAGDVARLILGAAAWHRGILTVNRDPSPGRLVTEICPWIDEIKCLTIERPSPVPPSSRLRALSTR